MELEALQTAFDQQELFEGKSWQLSPEPWRLTPAIVESIQAIGQASFEFYRALETLYLRSREHRKILRNKDFYAPWIAEYLDRGKPTELLGLANAKFSRGRAPPVIRPDILVTESGFTITELDSVPGGIGLTAYLNRLYQQTSKNPILGADGAMESAFFRRLASLASKESPLIAIVVSEEAATYKPEMDWLAEQLQRQGRRVFSIWTEEVFPLGGSLCFDVEGNPEKIDVVYRFFELFDLPNIKTASFMIDALEAGEVAIDPPLRPFLEEKLGLALYRHHLLQDFWKESLSKTARKVLDQSLPESWIVDPVPVPPTASLEGPLAQGRALHDWMDLADASQKERNLVLKISGFHETAWGARSVVIGNDVSKEDWRESLEDACGMADRHLHVLQTYHKPIRMKHPLYSDNGEVSESFGRLRLNPYFFTHSEGVELAGALATFCPPDKKIIHGMEDAALLPCCIVG